MGVHLTLQRDLYLDLLVHLLPGDYDAEQAAFLFAKPIDERDLSNLRVVDHTFVEESGLRHTSFDCLELADETRANVIKRAHDLSSSLVEVHSHCLPCPAAFSPTDIEGLREFVPHVWWRLRGRPYLALVVAPGTIDGLAWVDNPDRPIQLEALLVNEDLVPTTGLSLHRWDDHE